MQGEEANDGIIFETFFCLINLIFDLKKKKRDESKFSWSALLFKDFFTN